ncbi:hypothetical protein PQR62_23775 [Herbaspirillum lusitanum]|jgi:hypothetical protein|uniref:Uncharacterized protein n=1 Tax=Herbaspirillum lusitanum TaxID=213312 RepID=A0ABW9AHU1_9BURK
MLAVTVTGMLIAAEFNMSTFSMMLAGRTVHFWSSRHRARVEQKAANDDRDVSAHCEGCRA